MTGSFDIYMVCESLHHVCRTGGGGLRLGIRASSVNIYPDVFYIQNRERTKYPNLTSRLVTRAKR